jgi:murein L,D-transpeptidase YcbB/YkuD
VAPAAPIGVQVPAAVRASGSLRAVIDREAPAWLAQLYRANGYRLLWAARGQLRPDAQRLVGLLEQASDDGLDPTAYDPAGLKRRLAAARSGEAADVARAELALSIAMSAYLSDLHRPPAGATLAFRDPDLPPALDTPRVALSRVFAAQSTATGLAAAQRMHPVYEALRDELARRGAADPLRPLIQANMDRARALPGSPQGRHVVVDAAAQRLWLYEDGQVIDTMKVVVGTPRDPTPVMAGLMRYASYRPYWNVPVDIVRDEIAPRVLSEGPSYLERQEMEVLSDWTADAYVVDPVSVDWPSVAVGTTQLRVRRRPGDGNILGQVKLMLPNRLGIYLHDTPNKQLFERTQRTLSHGCIRLEDAQRLARRLIGPGADHPPPGDDARVDLPEPVPVYIVYLTAAVENGQVVRRRDIYRRDAALRAELGLARGA